MKNKRERIEAFHYGDKDIILYRTEMYEVVCSNGSDKPIRRNFFTTFEEASLFFGKLIEKSKSNGGNNGSDPYF